MSKSQLKMVEGAGKEFQAEGTMYVKKLKQKGGWDTREVEENQ